MIVIPDGTACRMGYIQRRMNMKTAIIDYGTGNLRSVENALKRLNAGYVITSDASVIRSAGRVILPGVGEASTAMEKLCETGLDKLIPSLTQPVLGICIGMQLMCEYSEEGNTRCLGIFRTAVRRLGEDPGDKRQDMGTSGGTGLKIPEMGWNSIRCVSPESGKQHGKMGDGRMRSPLFDGIPDESHVYYVHSFAPDICADTIAITEYGRPFSAALGRGNFFGTQFHPEKSGSIGQRLLANFLEA